MTYTKKNTAINSWFIREFMSAVIFIEAYWKPQTVVWGTKQFRLRYGGVTEIVNKKS
jgi:hypothetical protein